MFYVYLITFVVILYIVCDISYVIRTCFTVWCSRLFKEKCCLNDVTTIYGMCTFQDCDIWFKSMRLARLIRELDFARYHFYDCTGIYRRSRQCGIRSLQGSTLTISTEPVPMFKPYKILTKLVYWDERSLFFEHKVVTLHDNMLRCMLVSRQFAIGKDKETTAVLLDGLPGSSRTPNCPEYIKTWLNSMRISSEQLRNWH
ncbi:protein THEM6-like [Epargyreus clarus]|uniref:protein THEM6-like n=1 Tax=Epargyreus clarus TaxID=520877 RepID=UPI003C309DFA